MAELKGIEILTIEKIPLSFTQPLYGMKNKPY